MTEAARHDLQQLRLREAGVRLQIGFLGIFDPRRGRLWSRFWKEKETTQ